MMAYMKQNLINSESLHLECMIIKGKRGLRLYSKLHAKKSFAVKEMGKGLLFKKNYYNNHFTIYKNIKPSYHTSKHI